MTVSDDDLLAQAAHGDRDTLAKLLGMTFTTPGQQAARNQGDAAIRWVTWQPPDAARHLVETYDLRGGLVEGVANGVQRSWGAVFALRAGAHWRPAEIRQTTSEYLTAST
jgi:hypothetical protein